ncbi:hypothetical protein PYCC9005_001142 [Savitreella phatthalungensis]
MSFVPVRLMVSDDFAMLQSQPQISSHLPFPWQGHTILNITAVTPSSDRALHILRIRTRYREGSPNILPDFSPDSTSA